MKNFKWWIVTHDYEQYPARGLALVYHSGCLGPLTWGNSGENMFLDVSLTFIRWTWTLHTTWQRFHSESRCY